MERARRQRPARSRTSWTPDASVRRAAGNPRASSDRTLRAGFRPARWVGRIPNAGLGPITNEVSEAVSWDYRGHWPPGRETRRARRAEALA